MPLKAPSLGIQLPKRQSQSIGELRVWIVTPSPAMLAVKEASPAMLAVKEASLIEEGVFERYSTEPDPSALLSMKAIPAMERDSLLDAKTTPPYCGCEERAG